MDFAFHFKNQKKKTQMDKWMVDVMKTLVSTITKWRVHLEDNFVQTYCWAHHAYITVL
jgi:hypothetical protein